MDEDAGKKIDEALLVRRVQSELPYGTTAFRDLVEIYTPRIRTRAFRMVGNVHDADDVVQDVFVRVFRSIRKYKFDKPLQHWLYTITSNSSRNLLRTRARDQRRTAEFARHVRIQEGARRGEPVILGRALESALDSLDPSTRLAILLRYVEERTFPEIAEDLGMGESAVKMRVRRGLETLRASINKAASG